MKNLTENEKALKANADTLAQKIEFLTAIAVDNTDMKAKFSPLIMQMLRAEHVYIPEVIVGKYYSERPHATLIPDELLTTLPEEVSDKKYQPIFANSFGSWDADFYFSNDCECRILWLIKEPYIEKPSWDDYDRGGHNQAKENLDYNKIDNTTLKNIIKISKEIIKKRLNRDVLEPEVMKHVCIIEANHFPGLAFHSTTTDDDTIGKWITKINESLLSALIDFYRPSIVISSRLTLLYTTTDNNFFQLGTQKCIFGKRGVYSYSAINQRK